MTNKEAIIEIIKSKLQNDLRDRFVEVVKKSINSFRGEIEKEQIKTSFSPYLCPDQYVVGKTISEPMPGDYVKRIPLFRGQGDGVIEANIPEAENIMILILESPHQKEFDRKGEPIGPAMGPTRENIENHLKTVFPNFSDYHLVLMNAIPFQCSLGQSSKPLRDWMFVKTWEAFGKDFFQTRLTYLLDSLKRKGNRVVVVNACTQGGDKKDYLCCKVCKSIIEILSTKKLPYYHIHHPSSWRESNSDSSKKPKSNTLEIDKNGICKSFQYTKECKLCKDCYGKIKYKF